MKRLVQIVLGFSAIAVIIGVILIFQIDPEKRVDSTLIASIFSLSSVFVFAAALYYQAASLKKQTEAVEKQGHALDVQIKEFQLQQVELKKSVQAQTKTSNVLDEQRKIMLEQKSDAFLMGLFNGFNAYKNEELSKMTIKTFHNSLFDKKYQYSTSNLDNFKMKVSEALNYYFRRSQNLFTKYKSLSEFTHMFWNIIYQIEKIDLPSDKKNFYLAYFIGSLTIQEKIALIFSELQDIGGSMHYLYLYNAMYAHEILKRSSETLISDFMEVSFSTFLYNAFVKISRCNKTTRWSANLADVNKKYE